ncbi:hypothetical protein [Bradyrhizobium sp. AZCC 2230]|uniref:hypothetical protein n=1 Tax=Bradyrhizobium sp. AZCC 2230 TaxID=3117021 RepID=UPI002FF20D39
MNQLVAGASVPERNNADILAALNNVAQKFAVDPAAIAAIIHSESVWDTRCVTGSYIGLTQVGPDFVESLGLDTSAFLNLGAADQINDYGRWLAYYNYSQQMTRYSMNVAAQPIARQAAVLQAVQFSPNGVKWKKAFGQGDYSVPSTLSKQARFLGDTSISDMEAYYTGFFQQHPPSYAGNFGPTAMLARAANALAPAAALEANAGIQAAAPSQDKDAIANLIALGSDISSLNAAQATAAQRLLNFDGEIYPSDGCAITLSVLLQKAQINIADTYLAFDLGNKLKGRGWTVVPVGGQQAGDVGSTCGPTPHHGTDHIYLVLKPVNSDEMLIADNQAQAPHFRWASGKGGKSPTTFFLRAT